MSILDYHDLDELKNKNEDMVWKAIEKHLGANPTLCRCRDCVLDVAALALNALPPRYHVYDFHTNAPEEKEPGAEVQSAVAEAYLKVSTRPHH